MSQRTARLIGTHLLAGAVGAGLGFVGSSLTAPRQEQNAATSAASAGGGDAERTSLAPGLSNQPRDQQTPALSPVSNPALGVPQLTANEYWGVGHLIEHGAMWTEDGPGSREEWMPTLRVAKALQTMNPTDVAIALAVFAGQRPSAQRDASLNRKPDPMTKAMLIIRCMFEFPTDPEGQAEAYQQLRSKPGLLPCGGYAYTQDAPNLVSVPVKWTENGPTLVAYPVTIGVARFGYRPGYQPHIEFLYFHSMYRYRDLEPFVDIEIGSWRELAILLMQENPEPPKP